MSRETSTEVRWLTHVATLERRSRAGGAGVGFVACRVRDGVSAARSTTSCGNRSSRAAASIPETAAASAASSRPFTPRLRNRRRPPPSSTPAPSFHALRLEPYLLATARAHPDLAAMLEALAERTARHEAHRRAWRRQPEEYPSGSARPGLPRCRVRVVRRSGIRSGVLPQSSAVEDVVGAVRRARAADVVRRVDGCVSWRRRLGVRRGARAAGRAPAAGAAPCAHRRQVACGIPDR